MYLFIGSVDVLISVCCVSHNKFTQVQQKLKSLEGKKFFFFFLNCGMKSCKRRANKKKKLELKYILTIDNSYFYMRKFNIL